MNAVSLTESLARFAAGLSLDDIPEDVRLAARLHIADALGVGLAASRLPKHRQMLASLAAEQPQGGSCTVLGLAEPRSPTLAALLNGTSIHALEFDDTHMASVVHGSAVIVSSALAASEHHRLSFDDFVRLVVIGWEVLVRIGQSSPGGFQKQGFQVTSAAGVIVAALLGSLARGGSIAETVHAMGIAGSQASGIFEFLSNGSNVKALHPGWAAQGGLWAAACASAGVTGPRTVLEGRYGLFNVYARDGDAGQRLQAQLPSLGQDWRLRDAAFKLFPCCHYIHPFLECAQDIRRELGGAVPDGDIVFEVASGAAQVICEPWQDKQRPVDGNQAKYSLPYCVARILLGRPVDLAAMSADEVDQEAVALTVRMNWRERIDHDFPRRYQARISLQRPDGRQQVREVDQVRGSSERPADPVALQEKFVGNLSTGWRRSTAIAAWTYLVSDVRPAPPAYLRQLIS